MPPAATLVEAAEQSFTRLQTLFLAGTIKAKLTLFASRLLIATFPQAEPNNHPQSNWLTLLYVVASRMSSTPADITYDELEQSAEYLYRMCWMTDESNTEGLITNTQATAVLTEYNLDF